MVNDLLFALLASAVNPEGAAACTMQAPTQEQMQSLYKISKRHDLAHVVAFGLQRNGLLSDGEMGAKWQKIMMQAVYRCARQDQELESMTRVFEEAKIPFIPLKGSVIRKWYPEPWLRTSSDIDILIHKRDLQRATAVLQNRLQYTYHAQSPHDVSFDAPGGVHLELHFDLIDESVSKAQRKLLSDVWATATVEEDCEYRMVMEPQRFYFYHMAHFAKHFAHSGCGIRPFMDVWILNATGHYHSTMCAQMLEQGGLLTFAQAAEALAVKWFAGGQKDALQLQVEDYILGNSVHGSLDNIVLAEQAQHGSKSKALLSKIFLRYDAIKEYYPILKRHKWLLPFVEVYRWLRLLFGGSAGRVAHIVKENATISSDKAAQIGDMMHQLGL